MAKLFDVALELARSVTKVYEGEASEAGDAGGLTLTDKYLDNGDDDLKGGTLFVLTGTHADKLAHIAKFGKNAFTFRAGFGSAIGSGDDYAACGPDGVFWFLRQCINKAMVEIGPLPQENLGLTTVALQEEYTLPAGVQNVKRVEIATGTASPFIFKPTYYWTEPPGKLRFDAGYAPYVSGYTMRLTYAARPARLVAYSDTISPYLDQLRLAWEAAIYYWLDGYRIHGKDEETLEPLLNQATDKASFYRGQHPVPALERDPHYPAW